MNADFNKAIENTDVDNSVFSTPVNFQEFFTAWNKASGAEPFALDALQLTKQNAQRIVIPSQYISLDFIDELKNKPHGTLH